MHNIQQLILKNPRVIIGTLQQFTNVFIKGSESSQR